MALAALVAAVNPMVAQLVVVEEFGVDRRSWVVAHLASGLSAEAVDAAEGGLLRLKGVDGITLSTDRELSLVAAIDTPVADLQNYRTLGLDGAADAPSVSFQAREVDNVDSAYPRIAQSPDSRLGLVSEIWPIVTGLMVAFTLILVVRSVVVRSQAVPAGSLLNQWLRMVVSTVLPVVFTVVGATLIAALVWPPLVYPLVSSTASDLISSRAVAQPGLEAAVYAGGLLMVLALLALTTLERPEPKHLA